MKNLSEKVSLLSNQKREEISEFLDNLNKDYFNDAALTGIESYIATEIFKAALKGMSYYDMEGVPENNVYSSLNFIKKGFKLVINKYEESIFYEEGDIYYTIRFMWGHG